MIGAVADDFTGATDVAVAFRRAGLRTVVVFDHDRVGQLPPADAAVVALKTRTIDADVAVAQSLAATAWLRNRGAMQIFFKYCSTFDSRPQGNIGPVADALLAALDASHAVFVPASPKHLRTQYMGHLFVDRVLLSASPMRHHPLTPMTESYLPSVLAAQTDLGVALIDHRAVRQGVDRINELLTAAENHGTPYLLVDALDDADLCAIGESCIDDVLVTGAAGLAGGLGAAYARRHRLRDVDIDHYASDNSVPSAALAGSCSAATLDQIENMRLRGHPSLRLDAVVTPDHEVLAKQALEWYDKQDPTSGPLIYASLPPNELRQAQAALGTERSADILDSTMGLIACGLVDRGVGRLIVAGGETSGAVVKALRVRDGIIGDEAAPGVPWIHTVGERPVALLLKSGNFGDPLLLADAVAGAR